MDIVSWENLGWPHLEFLKVANRSCGTELYMVNEIHLGYFYGPELDWWAIWVFMHEMMVGK